MKIMKFGGSSVNTPERIKNVIQIVKNSYSQHPALIVVVSAFGGVTDELIKISQLASLGDKNYIEFLSKIKTRHLEALYSLIPEENVKRIVNKLDENFMDLHDTLHGISLVKELSKRSLDYIMSFGERLSAYIINEAMTLSIPSSKFVDARELIKTDNNFGHARVNYELTYSKLQKHFLEHASVAVMTGFIGSTEENETTTLGRGGSDFTASIVGAGLKAQEIEIWTDVDGVLTADPRKVKSAFPISQMSYKEALELSHFGAKVIYPPTIIPALKEKIPLRIKNSFNPKAFGTFITNESRDNGTLIRGVSSIDSVALLRLEGSGIVGVCGIAMRLFGALAKKEISVILISQGSSEHSICFAIEPQAADLAKKVIEEEFYLERQAGFIDPIVIEKPLSLIAVVGENMRKMPGIAGKLFGVLGTNGISVVAIVQGSSEYNISLAVDQVNEKKALNVIHEAFFQPESATLNVFMVGTGLIGKTLLSQMKEQLPVLQKEENIHIKLVGLANSQKMCFDPEGFNVQESNVLLEKAHENMDMTHFIRHMKHLNLMNSVFVDCTASEEIAEAYATILKSNISIVTPNKKANSGSYGRYQTLKHLRKARGVKFLYETNVGAGLPILSTIADLLKSGDVILKIEAILSGTLSYIFNHFQGKILFSEVVKQAQQRGYTEPDPREDLSGQDVLRKLLILARESGYSLEIEDILLNPLLPKECFEATTNEDFYHKLVSFDSHFEKLKQQAHSESKVLRYIASFDGVGSIGLTAVNEQHPFYHLSGCDNVIALTTKRYKETPLVIKGQGAGAEVTAGEVFADIIRIASS